MRRDGIRGEDSANLTHYAVGQKVRKTIEDLEGTMPEELPSADSVKKAEKRINNLNRKKINK